MQYPTASEEERNEVYKLMGKRIPSFTADMLIDAAHRRGDSLESICKKATSLMEQAKAKEQSWEKIIGHI